MGNEFTDRARVQVKFCSQFSFFRSLSSSPFPVLRFIRFIKTELTQCYHHG